jgi:hypothetical protein
MNAVQREREQKGIYINFPNTIAFKGKSLMAVGNQVMLDDNEHATFHELVLKNLQHTLGKEWWDAESAKPEDEQHFIRRCFSEISNNQLKTEQDVHQETPHVRSFLPTGHLQSLMNLAFDVYILTHKGFLPDDWLRRLRSREEYQGVRYEIAVASLFVRMGCTLEFYDDTGIKPKPMRPEFIATHTETGNRIAVEAKSRQRPGVIHAKGEQNLTKAMLGDVTKLFNKALKKQNDDLPYLIFIDVNAPTGGEVKTMETRWFADIRKMMEAQGENTPENPQPYTALVVTNYSPHYEGDQVTPTGGNCIVAGMYVEHPFADGLDGVFLGKLQQAVNGYGYVPRL